MRKNKNYLVVPFVVILIGLTTYWFLIPQGSYIHVSVDVQDDTIQIEEFGLKKGYPMNVMGAEDALSYGDRSIILRTFHNGTEFLTSVKNNVGTGNCAIQSEPIPSNIPIDTELLIQVELLDADGQLISQVSDRIVYK